MINRFQKFFTTDEATPLIIEIIKLFHPNHPEVWHSVSGKTTWKITDKSIAGSIYDWVTISIKKTGVDIGIKFNISLWGKYRTLIEFEDQIKTQNFVAWRFVTDKEYTENSERINLNSLFEKYNVPKPTAKELMKYYYSD